MAEDDNDDSGLGVDLAKLHKRGDINILLCGATGTSKSQLLGYVNKLSPRGVYTSRKGSSDVGITVSIVVSSIIFQITTGISFTRQWSNRR